MKHLVKEGRSAHTFNLNLLEQVDLGLGNLLQNEIEESSIGYSDQLILINLSQEIVLCIKLFKDKLSDQHYCLLSKIMVKSSDVARDMIIKQKNIKGQLDLECCEKYLTISSTAIKYLYKHAKEFSFAVKLLNQCQETIQGLQIISFLEEHQQSQQINQHLYELILVSFKLYLTPQNVDKNSKNQFDLQQKLYMLSYEEITNHFRGGIKLLQKCSQLLDQSNLAKILASLIKVFDVLSRGYKQIHDQQSHQAIFEVLQMFSNYLKDYQIKPQQNNRTLNKISINGLNTNMQSSIFVQALYKKFMILAADLMIQMQQYETVPFFLEETSQFIQIGEKDEIKILLLAFKLNCLSNQQVKDQTNSDQEDQELISSFLKLFQHQHFQSEISLECFKTLAICNRNELSITVGLHILKLCDKLLIDIRSQKEFIMRFLMIFERYMDSKKIKDYINLNKKTPGNSRISEILDCLVNSLSKLISLEFIKQCKPLEVKSLFYSVWNVAFETHKRGMIKECQLLLRQLYDQVKKFTLLYKELSGHNQHDYNQIQPKLTKPNQKQFENHSELTKNQLDEKVVTEIILKTLWLVCEMNLQLKNYQDAHKAIKDMELIQRNDASTYLLKIRVLFCQIEETNTHESQQLNLQTQTQHEQKNILDEIMATMTQLQRTEDFNFVHILSILEEAMKSKIQNLLHIIAKDEINQAHPNFKNNKMQHKPFTFKNFTLVKFLASIINEKSIQELGNCDQKVKIEKLQTLSQEFIMNQRIIKPMLNFIQSIIYQNDQNQELSLVERKEKLSLLIDYQDAQWLSNLFWIEFNSYIQNRNTELMTDSIESHQKTDYKDIYKNSEILESHVLFAQVSDLFLELEMCKNDSLDMNQAAQSNFSDQVVLDFIKTKEQIVNSLLLLIQVKYSVLILNKPLPLNHDIFEILSEVQNLQSFIMQALDTMGSHNVLKEILNPNQNVQAKLEDKKTLQVPLKQLKNKKIQPKLQKAKDFLLSTLSFIEIMEFKLKVRQHFDESQIEVQQKLLKKLIETVLLKLNEFRDEINQSNALQELLSAHKDLVEITESPSEKLLFLNQTFKHIENANFEECVNLDYLKWMIGLSWNQGISLYKKQDQYEAMQWLNFSIMLLKRSEEQCQLKLSQNHTLQRPNQSFNGISRDANDFQNTKPTTTIISPQRKEEWLEFANYLKLIAPKMEDYHQKVLYEVQ
eukprot:403340135